MPGHGAMPLMPSGAGPVAAMVLLAIAALHTIHARAEHGFPRWWHGSHVAMSAGMIVMFVLPHADHVYAVLAIVFGAHAVAMTIALPRVSGGVGRWVWAAAIADGLCMTYMLAPWRVVTATALAVGYLVAVAVAWAAVRRVAVTPSVRLTLTTMALIMAWMLLSMQLASSQI